MARTSSVAALERLYAARLAAVDLRALERERDVYRAAYEAESVWYEKPVVIVPLTVIVTLGVAYVAAQFMGAQPSIF